MGGCLGARITAEVDQKPKWRSLLTHNEALEKYSQDASMPPDCSKTMLECRVFLDDPDLINAVATYAKSNDIEWKSFYCCWSDIQHFTAIGAECLEFQKSKACLMYENYFTSPEQLGILTDSPLLKEISSINKIIHNVDTTVLTLPQDMFNKLAHYCIEEIHTRVFLPFKQTEAYAAVVNYVKKSVDVIANNFEYMGELGQGGYGVVVHVRKKSTRIDYAMKIQSKRRILEANKHHEERCLNEKKAMISCSHPYIIGLEYAFQTPSLVAMVMELGTGIFSYLSFMNMLFYVAFLRTTT